ncbi:MAG: ABC transporter ATP-binding protein [Deltaproteobacteria bacterium]|nr:MAG: ABC transporter ATP-binding protein [Deltaproteobacteria bacterium]
MIRTVNLKKSYGNFEALQGIDLEVHEGDLFGFIGPNGAGKTTTIRILTTLLEPSAGEAYVGELSVWEHKQEIRGLIGYMPDSFGVYRDMTVTEYLHFFAAAYGIPHKERASLVGGLLDLTDLTYKENALIETLSRGMQQRLGLARTLVHDPKVLILDEPASGLDPRARVEIREILRELKRMGKTILLSSHILSELAEVCNRVGILERGELVAQGSIDEIMAMARNDTEVWLRTTDDARAAVVLRELSIVHSAELDEEKGHVVAHIDTDADLGAVSEHLHGREIRLRYLERQDPTLEEVFMKLTKGLVQ